MNIADELAAQLAAAEDAWIGTVLLIAAVSGFAAVMVLRDRRKRRREQQTDLNLWDVEVLTDAGQRAIHPPDRVDQLIADALGETRGQQRLRRGVCPDDLHDLHDVFEEGE